MREGIYAVRFKGPSGNAFGTVVIQGNSIWGGDNAFWYKGSFSVDGASVKGKAHCEKHSNAGHSVFGAINNFDLVLEGSTTDSGFSATGSLASNSGMGIKLDANWVSELE